MKKEIQQRQEQEREVLLTVEERVFEKDLEKSGLELNGFVGDTLDTIKLPEGWVFEIQKKKSTKRYKRSKC